MAAAAAAARNLWRKKLVLHSKRVDVFMGCTENPMPPPPPPVGRLVRPRLIGARWLEKRASGGGGTEL
ncbi:hypothetical protein OsI_31177 [Oryza sativa Indica Group]|uniref:Uncharacterized protein n=1 Tax=Oryza sativa subsp. indica TaxID=39946 RepID=A2Z0Q1_ORYSI|nr:hypothetical protein OsI_31177 [Oryza sativa Indica Group]